MEHDCATETVAGATLVTVRVRNEAAVPRRVRVRNELPGPVLPPRREGVPERGWGENGFEAVVAGGGTRTLGYACPVVDDRNPVSVESLGRAEGERAGDLESGAIRALGRARPPADAVPIPDAVPAPDVSLADGAGSDDAVPDSAGESAPSVTDAHADDAERDTARGSAAVPTGATPERRRERVVRPPAVDSWFDAAEARIRLAERLTEASAADAATALEAAGDVSGLPSAVDADERALRSVAERASALAEWAAETDADPVVAALEGL